MAAREPSPWNESSTTKRMKKHRQVDAGTAGIAFTERVKATTHATP
jgi:hypothetical protein